MHVADKAGFNLIMLASYYLSFYSFTAGRVAALNMLKKPTKIESVPFFWTVLLGKSIRYAGGVLIEKMSASHYNIIKLTLKVSFPLFISSF